MKLIVAVTMLMNDDISLNENHLKSKMRIDEYGEDSSVENRDDNEVSRWEDLQRILTNITFEINFVKNISSFHLQDLQLG